MHETIDPQERGTYERTWLEWGAVLIERSTLLRR